MKLIATLSALLLAASASAEWSHAVKSAHLAQLDGIWYVAGSVNSAVTCGKNNSSIRPQVNTFISTAIDAYNAHFVALVNVADMYGRFTDGTDRPIYSCGAAPAPCGPQYEPPLPPRATVLGFAETLMSEAVSKYATADAALAVIEGTCGGTMRAWFDNGRNAANAMDWTLDWSEPRPVDGVLSAPGYTRDTAPAYYPMGSWLNQGRGIGKGLHFYSTSWKRMVEGAMLYDGAALNNGAFANRHLVAIRSLLSAHGLMVGVEMAQVVPHLNWMADPPAVNAIMGIDFPPPPVSRQQLRWTLVREIVNNIDPGGAFGVGSNGAPRGFDYSGRSYIETPTPEYNERQICYGMTDYLGAKFSGDLFMSRWILALKDNCEAHFWLGTAAYRGTSNKYYPALPLGSGGAPPNPCAACGAGTECISGQCLPLVSVCPALAPLTLDGLELALCEVQP